MITKEEATELAAECAARAVRMMRMAARDAALSTAEAMAAAGGTGPEDPAKAKDAANALVRAASKAWIAAIDLARAMGADVDHSHDDYGHGSGDE